MKLIHLNTITFDTDQIIVAAAIAGQKEFVALFNSGDVVRTAVDGESARLFSVKENSIVQYPGGGFDLTSQCSIYTLDGIIAVISDYTRHGYVFTNDGKKLLHLWREDYNADITKNPVALFRNEAGVPCLIYSTAWNHLQIMDLSTRQILTATKSLIGEGEEERYRTYASRYHSMGNDLPWPPPFDYFYAHPLMSPDSKQFLSMGWGWGSCDSYKLFNVADFISNPLIRATDIGMWEHSNRAACWVDNNTIAVAYYPWREGDSGAEEGCSVELHIYDLTAASPEVISKFNFDAFDEVSGHLHYSAECEAFIAFTEEKGLSVCSRSGELLLRDEHFKPYAFDALSNTFITIAGNIITAYKLA